MILAILLFPSFVSAQSMDETFATPEILNEDGAILVISEVNFKNKEHDWVEIYYESPTRKTANLKGLKFQDDTAFKTIDRDFIVNSGSYILLTLKSELPDDQTGKKIYSAHSGLTGTTEQVILKNAGGSIIDAVCWSSKSPTTTEQKDLEELFHAEGWVSADPQSCIESDKITTNQSVVRRDIHKDTDSKSEWDTTDDATPGEPNNAVVSGGTTNTNAPLQPGTVSSPDNPAGTNTSNLTSAASAPLKNVTGTSAKISKTATAVKKTTTPVSNTKQQKPKTAASQKTGTTQKKSSKILYRNGNLSGDILINEFCPRTGKDDRSDEWVELYNNGEKEINLGNWKLDDEEGGSKPFTFSDKTVIPPNGYLMVTAQESKLSLNNAKDQVRLFDYTGKNLQTISYEEAPNKESYSRIIVEKEDGSKEEQWVWTMEPTPGKENGQYMEMSGTITADATFNGDSTFQMQTKNGDSKTILFDEWTIPGALAKATFMKGAEIKITAEKNGNDENTLKLRKYEVTSPPAKGAEIQWPYAMAAFLSCGTIALAYVFIRKKILPKKPLSKIPLLQKCSDKKSDEMLQ